MDVLKLVFLVMRSLFVSRAALAAQNLALRQQLAVLQRAARRPRLRRRDRVEWSRSHDWVAFTIGTVASRDGLRGCAGVSVQGDGLGSLQGWAMPLTRFDPESAQVN
jgi:hypothetical protein